MKRGRGHEGFGAKPADNAIEQEMRQAVKLHRKGKLTKAKSLYISVLGQMPNHYDALNLLGLIAYQTNDFERANELMSKAIQVKGNLPAIHSDRGVVLHCLKRFDEALASYDRAIAIKPDFAEAYCNRGNTLKEINRLEEALASYDLSTEINPDYAEAYCNRGDALNKLNRFGEALASCDHAILLKPEFAEAYCNRGNALKELKRFDEAIADYDRAIAIKPDYAECHWNKGIILLLTGEVARGWELYEYRWKRDTFTSPKRNFSQPLWLGAESLEGKTILLHAEQGFGDSIQFCRYVKLVHALGARVVLETPRRLADLFARLEGVDELVVAGEELPSFQYHCPLLSLPLAFRTTLAGIPSPGPYLTSDSDKHSAWIERIGPTTKLRVGIVWSGSVNHKNDRNRSIKLLDFLNHFSADCDYVSLQKEVREADNAFLSKGAIKHYGNEQLDFSDTAALCELMDVVVTVDTAVAHLAGALGKPTWVLLQYVPDWRWLLDRDGSPWYQSVKLYRQDEDWDWQPVLRRVADDLSKLANGRS